MDTSNVSTKFGVWPNPNTVNGNCKLKWADCVSWEAVNISNVQKVSNQAKLKIKIKE